MKRFILLSSLVGFTGFFLQLYFTVNAKLIEGHSLIYALNYFLSFFTVITNLAVAFLLLC
jgi:hypothetical protein